jgi:ATP-dependent protease ClpP protease subunit
MIKITKRFELSANPVNPDATDIYLYGYVTDKRWWDDDECIATKEVREALLSIKTSVINLHINSPGGDAFDGIAIHNLLKQHSATVNAYVDGIAASAASLIIMAADKIFMPANTMLFIHRASTIAWGNAEALRKEAEDLEKLDAAVLASYKTRFVGTEEELAALLGEETLLNANEAKALGLCDEVLEDIPKKPPDNNNGEPPKNAILSRYGYKNEIMPLERPQTSLNLSKCLEAFFNGFEEEKK